MNVARYLPTAFILIVATLSAASCQEVFVQNYTARYHWNFFKTRPDATPKEKAFKECEAVSKRRNRFIGDETIRGYSFAGDVLTCMKWEGWGQSTRAVTFEPTRRVE
jgi:hypothetical protein